MFHGIMARLEISIFVFERSWEEMNIFIGILLLGIGFLSGFGVAHFLKILKVKTAKEIAEEVLAYSDTKRTEHVEAVVKNLKESFGSLSLEALSRSTEEFLKLAQSRLQSEREFGVKELDTKKGLIDQQLSQMTGELKHVTELIRDLENDRKQKFGELTSHLRTTGEQTMRLMQTTNMLRETLASTKARGQWGERMAEDVLRIAGFVEHINYEKQQTIELAGSRPDFTFLLPRDLKVNMDVKFPYEKYVRYIETSNPQEKETLSSDFLKDVKNRIKEVTTRDYINPEQNTVDYVLLFIPNEQIYSFIHEKDHSILDEGLKNKVILCSPVTLFAVLAVIRQAVDNFALEKTSNEILALLGKFKREWEKFTGKFDSLGKKINDTQKEFDELTSTRKRMLERPLGKLDDLRTQRGLSALPDEIEE
jgi:DNA recombination protein RmuC